MATSITNTSVTTDNLTVDTNVLHVDSTNNRVGIGTASPGYPLQVNGSVDILNVKGSTGNAFVRFTDSDATADFSIGADDGSSAGAGAFILYDRSNSAYRLLIDSAGRVTMPNQPAWWAQTYNTYSFTATGTLEFNSTNVGMAEKLDVGNNYNPTTGRFTAPVAGTYFVMLTCSASYGSNYLYLYIMKNGSDIISRNYAQNSQYLEQTLQVVTTLAVGDYVSCKTEKNYVGGALYGPSFCGFLIG